MGQRTLAARGAAMGMAADLGSDGEWKRWEGRRTLATTGSGGDGKGGGPWRRRGAAEGEGCEPSHFMPAAWTQSCLAGPQSLWSQAEAETSTTGPGGRGRVPGVEVTSGKNNTWSACWHQTARPQTHQGAGTAIGRACICGRERIWRQALAKWAWRGLPSGR